MSSHSGEQFSSGPSGRRRLRPLLWLALGPRASGQSYRPCHARPSIAPGSTSAREIAMSCCIGAARPRPTWTRHASAGGRILVADVRNRGADPPSDPEQGPYSSAPELQDNYIARLGSHPGAGRVILPVAPCHTPSFRAQLLRCHFVVARRWARERGGRTPAAQSRAPRIPDGPCSGRRPVGPAIPVSRAWSVAGPADVGAGKTAWPRGSGARPALVKKPERASTIDQNR